MHLEGNLNDWTMNEGNLRSRSYLVMPPSKDPETGMAVAAEDTPAEAGRVVVAAAAAVPTMARMLTCFILKCGWVERLVRSYV